MRTAVLVLLISLVACPALAGEWRVPDGDWHRIEYAGMDIITDVKPKKALELAQRLSRLDEWLEIFAVIDPGYRRPRKLYLFKNRESFEPYLPLYKGEPAHLAGFTVMNFDGIFMALDESSYEDPLVVLFHEYVHAFLAERAPRSPLWVQEGIAELHTNFTVDGDFVVVGKTIEDHCRVLREELPIELGRFLQMNADASEYNEGDRQSTFYSQAWASVHYILTNKELRGAFKDYMRRLHEGEPDATAMRYTIGDRFPRVNPDLRDYLSQRKLPHFRLERPAKKDTGSARVERLEPVDVFAELGDLLVHVKGSVPGRAVTHFEGALSLQPGHLLAMRGLAYARAQEGDRAGAIQLLEEMGPEAAKEVGVGALLGNLLLVEGGLMADEVGRATNRNKAHRTYQAVLDGEPENAVALFGLGHCLFQEGRLEEARVPLERAAELSPWREDVQVSLVLLHCARGDVAEARAVFEHGLSPLTSPKKRFDTQLALINAEISHAMELAREGDHAAAALVLTESRRLAEGREVEALVDRNLANVEVNEQVQRFERARVLFEGGDLPAALEILEKLKSEDLDESLQGPVDYLLGWIEERVG